MRFRLMTTVAGRAGAPVPSKTRPPLSTMTPSGPRGPGGTGMRRGSSVVWVFDGSIHLRLSCALSWGSAKSAAGAREKEPRRHRPYEKSCPSSFSFRFNSPASAA